MTKTELQACRTYERLLNKHREDIAMEEAADLAMLQYTGINVPMRSEFDCCCGIAADLLKATAKAYGLDPHKLDDAVFVYAEEQYDHFMGMARRYPELMPKQS